MRLWDRARGRRDTPILFNLRAGNLGILSDENGNPESA
jgi:hypothetical protein